MVVINVDMDTNLLLKTYESVRTGLELVGYVPMKLVGDVKLRRD